MKPRFTYELEVTVTAKDHAIITKEHLKAWLHAKGIDTLVEGSLENLHIESENDLVSATKCNHTLEHNQFKQDEFQMFGGDATPLKVCGYDQLYLEGLNRELLNSFGDKVTTKIVGMETDQWASGWKKSFEPIEIGSFYIAPPWVDVNSDKKDRMHITIDPGIAFGTGQHESTQLCLLAMNTYWQNHPNLSKKAFLDVGIGSGILAIAAKKMGFSIAVGCDIDPNSALACQENCTLNQVDVPTWTGILPFSPEKLPSNQECASIEKFDLVAANILHSVIDDIIGDLANELAMSGQLILSGLLAEQTTELLDKISNFYLNPIASWQSGEWACLLLEKNI